MTHISISKRVESKISDGDVRGAITILSSDDTLAPQNQETLSKLKLIHPTPSRTLEFHQLDSSIKPISVVDDDVREAILSFHNGSAGGIDGLRPQHMKDLISVSLGEAGTKFLNSCTRLLNLMLSGEVNPNITCILYGACLCALNKKDGGIRPIAVGTTYRRLAAKLACKNVRESIGNYLRPCQVGFGTKSGCEAIVHSARSYIEKNKSSNKVILKIDFKNAFNSVERDIMLNDIKEIAPEILPFLSQCYKNSSFLSFGLKKILSEVGAQQGDPAGPMLFCLAIQPIISKLTSEFNAWYLDDGTLGGSPDLVLADFEKLIDKCKHLGLKLNPQKCEIFFCSSHDPDVAQSFENVCPGIRIITENLNLLGAPLIKKSTNFIFDKKLENLKLLLKNLELLNSHVAYYLLRHCLAVPKLSYLLRTSPLNNFEDIIKLFDQEIFKTLEKLINIKLNEKQLQIASLPIKHGGLGIRKIEDIYLAAFLSSVNTCSNIVFSFMSPNKTENLSMISGYSESLEEWKNINHDIPVKPNFQKNWDKINTLRIYNGIYFENDIDKARFFAANTPFSGAWLNVLPSKNIGTFLNDNVFRISVALRLGCNICEPHRCICGEKVDRLGTHGLSCKRSAGRQSRHHEINTIIQKALASANIPSILEPIDLFRQDGKRVDGMSLIPWSKGEHIVWDATCVDTLAPSHLPLSSKSNTEVANNAAKMKKRKYNEIIEAGYIFVAFAVETLGPWCQEAINFVEILGKKMYVANGDSRSKYYLIQRISLAIQRGNAASVMGTLPSTAPLDEIFLLPK